MCLKHPFNGSTMKQLITNIMNSSYPPPPPIYSKPLMDLVAFLLQKNPKNRPSINQLLRFPFIQQHIGRFLTNHKIQEEFSHTVLHGNLGLVAGRPAAAPQLPSREQAQARAQALAAQQEAERAREAQQQREAQARDAAKAQAIARAKALAVEQAEKARLAHVAALRAQHEARARQEAADAQRLRALREARAREQHAKEQAREQAQREQREQREAQAAKDAVNRQRRADERARQIAEAKEREQWRDVQRPEGGGRPSAAARHAAEWEGVALAPKRRSPAPAARPPWVGVIEPEEAAARAEEERRRDEEHAAARRAEERRAEDRQRARAAEERERERQRQARREVEERDRDRRPGHESIAPTMVRPVPRAADYGRDPRDAYRDPRVAPTVVAGAPQRMARAASAAELPSGMESRNERAAKQRAHEEQLARARREYFEERKQLEARQRGMLAGGGGGAQRSSSPPPPRRDDRYDPPRREERPAPSAGADRGRVSSETHEEQLARARKEYYEERKALEARQKAMLAGDAAEPAPDRNERPLGGAGAGGLKKAASEAVFDRPSSARKQAPERASPVPRKSSASPSLPPLATPAASSPSPDSSDADVPVTYRRGEKYGKEKAAAMAETEAELARLRVEYFEERKVLAARKQRALEEAGLAPKSTPPPTTANASQPPTHATPTTSTPATAASTTHAKKLGHADQLAQDRAQYFAAQRAAAKAAALAESPEVTGVGPLPTAAPASSSAPSSVLPRSRRNSLTLVRESVCEAEPEVDADPAVLAQEAEASIDELASNTGSCEQMLQLMQTMRDVMRPPTGAEDDEDAIDADEEEEEEYQIPSTTESEDASDATDVAVQEDGVASDDSPSETDAEADARNEFNTFRESELRDAVASALAASAEHDLDVMRLDQLQAEPEDDEEEEEPEEEQEEEADDVDSLPAPAVDESAPPRHPSNTSSLYNSSVTLPPNKVVVASADSSAVPAAAVHERPSSAATVDSSFTEDGADPMSYKVESLRLFLSEKLGDDLLLDIYRLLRRSMSGGVQTVTTVYTHAAESAHSSPATTASLQPPSARGSSASSGGSSSRRGSISSLVVNHLNIRDLLTNSGLLTPPTTKYISLIQQLIKAEHALYGQL